MSAIALSEILKTIDSTHDDPVLLLVYKYPGLEMEHPGFNYPQDLKWNLLKVWKDS